MLRHIHPKVVLRRDGASRTRIPPVLETGSLAAGSSLCIRKAARQVSLRAAPGRNWFVPIQKPPASPECPSVARTRVCRHTFRLAGDRLPRVSRVFLPVGVLPVIESTCGRWVSQRFIPGAGSCSPFLPITYRQPPLRARISWGHSFGSISSAGNPRVFEFVGKIHF